MISVDNHSEIHPPGLVKIEECFPSVIQMWFWLRVPFIACVDETCLANPNSLFTDTALLSV